MQRPTSVTVIAWILIVISGIALIINLVMLANPALTELMAKNPMPIPLQYAITFLGLLISMGAGFAMLKGKNWGRLLYTAWGVIGFVVGFSTSPMKVAMIPGVIFFLVIATFLFLPKANKYFSHKVTADDAQSV
ncbi:MAG: hypothetical protein WCB49_07415 [Gammaproteobacteria bacterium]